MPASDPFQDISVSAGEFHLIYDPGAGEEKDWYINDHCFIWDGQGRWHLFGITHEEPAAPQDEDHLAHATAPRLAAGPWVKQPFALSARTEEPWNERHLWAPHVIRHDGLYWMYVCGGGLDSSQYQIQLALSEDLWCWTRHPENPMVVDGFDARDPLIMRDGDQWIMYYTATSEPEGGNFIVAYQTSKDLVNWSGRGVAFLDPHEGTFGGPTESPFVLRRGDLYYLFLGPRGGYVGTDVFVSRDPFEFKVENLIGHIPSHAAEVIRDVDGSWWVSHSGWGQGGV